MKQENFFHEPEDFFRCTLNTDTWELCIKRARKKNSFSREFRLQITDVLIRFFMYKRGTGKGRIEEISAGYIQIDKIK